MSVSKTMVKMAESVKRELLDAIMCTLPFFIRDGEEEYGRQTDIMSMLASETENVREANAITEAAQGRAETGTVNFDILNGVKALFADEKAIQSAVGLALTENNFAGRTDGIKISAEQGRSAEIFVPKEIEGYIKESVKHTEAVNDFFEKNIRERINSVMRETDERTQTALPIVFEKAGEYPYTGNNTAGQITKIYETAFNGRDVIKNAAGDVFSTLSGGTEVFFGHGNDGSLAFYGGNLNVPTAAIFEKGKTNPEYKPAGDIDAAERNGIFDIYCGGAESAAADIQKTKEIFDAEKRVTEDFGRIYAQEKLFNIPGEAANYPQTAFGGYTYGDISDVKDISFDSVQPESVPQKIEIIFENGSITNNITANADTDTIIDEFADRLKEALTTAAEGAYSY